MTAERCSCGAREKSKCSKESDYGRKMCLKESVPIPNELIERIKVVQEKADENKAFDELTAKLWDEHPEEMAEAKAWAQEFIEEIKNETH